MLEVRPVSAWRAVALLLRCCCAAVPPHQLLPVKLLPSVRAELGWARRTNTNIVGRVFVCCLSFLNTLAHPAPEQHVVISTQKCGDMSLVTVMCIIYNIYTIYTICRTLKLETKAIRRFAKISGWLASCLIAARPL